MNQAEAVIFNSQRTEGRLQLIFAACFPLFTILALGIDSVYFTTHYFDGRQLTNILCILYFTGFYFASNSHLKKLMLVMIGLSYIGELIFCKVLGMYAYRTDAIALYVPFGHAIVYASGYTYANTEWSLNRETYFRKIFPAFFVLLFLSVGLFLKDYFSILLGILFFILLKRKRGENLYYFIAFCVIFIELAGTFFKCWTWIPNVFGLPTSNPPMGAVFIYAGGDVLIAKIVSVWKNKNKIE